MGPSQQLGAAPGTPNVNGVLGPEGFEPEGSIDGAEFASSGEAEVAPRAGADDLDEELTEETLNYVMTADRIARERAMNYVGDGSMNYDIGTPERDLGNEGPQRIEEVALGQGSRLHAYTATSAQSQATSVQTPAIPAQTPGHLSQEPAERASTSLDEEEAQLERNIAALLQQRQSSSGRNAVSDRGLLSSARGTRHYSRPPLMLLLRYPPVLLLGR